MTRTCREWLDWLDRQQERLLDAETGREQQLAIPAGETAANSASFSPDRTRLLAVHGTRLLAVLGMANSADQSILTLRSIRNRRGRLLAVTLTDRIEVVAPGAGVPTVTVTVFVNGRALGTVSLSDGTAVVTLKPKRVLRKAATINYSGDGDFRSSTSMQTVITPKSLRTMASSSANVSVQVIRRMSSFPRVRV